LMRMRVITGRWLYALLLCCAGTAIGQSVPGDVSADATDAFQVESSVSASVASMVDSAANTSGSGSRSAALNLLAGSKLPGASPNGPASSSIRQLELYGMRRGEAQRGLRTSLLAGRGVHLRPTGSGNNSRAGVPMAGAHQEKKPGIAGPQSSAGGGGASSSGGFPDSTKGTAQVSPPDPGTSSPLDWISDGLNFGISGFSERQFLNPNLQTQIGGKRRRSGQILSGRGRKARAQAPSAPSIEQKLEPDILSNETLTPDILNQSSPLTIEQQLGLPQ
jgi:hypothetical protein